MTEKSTIAQAPQSATSLRLVEPETLYETINRTYENIARRAFELFADDGWIPGRDLDHWFRAESEVLYPVPVSVAESGDALTAQAEVPGFSAEDLQVSLEPRRLTISGKRQSREERKEAKAVYEERRAREILRVIDLPADVNASRATATLKNGILELMMPRAAEKESTQVAVKVAGSAS